MEEIIILKLSVSANRAIIDRDDRNNSANESGIHLFGELLRENPRTFMSLYHRSSPAGLDPELASRHTCRPLPGLVASSMPPPRHGSS